MEEGNDEDFEEMMDQLMDRDGPQEQPILEVIEHSINDINESAYDVDDTQHDSQVYTVCVSMDFAYFSSLIPSSEDLKHH